MPAQLCADEEEEKVPTLPFKINDWLCASGLIKSLSTLSNLWNYNIVENKPNTFLLQNSLFVMKYSFYREEAIYFIYIHIFS